MYEVVLKPKHPTGVYHRAGMVFSHAMPVMMDKVPDAVKKDAWLVVKEVEDPKRKAAGSSAKAADK